MMRWIAAHGFAAVLAVAAWAGAAEARSLDDIIKAGVIRDRRQPELPAQQLLQRQERAGKASTSTSATRSPRR